MKYIYLGLAYILKEAKLIFLTLIRSVSFCSFVFFSSLYLPWICPVLQIAATSKFVQILRVFFIFVCLNDEEDGEIFVIKKFFLVECSVELHKVSR